MGLYIDLNGIIRSNTVCSKNERKTRTCSLHRLCRHYDVIKVRLSFCTAHVVRKIVSESVTAMDSSV